MSFSSNMQAVALKLLTNYGETITASKTNTASFNPDTGVTTENSPTNYTGVGHPSVYEPEYVDGVTVLSTDLRLIFYSDTMPEPGDTFVVNSESLTAISVRHTRAQGVSIVYIVQLR